MESESFIESSRGTGGEQVRADPQPIRAARGKFLAMAGAYSLGTFNDNFFKQAASLMAIAAGLSELQGWAAALFTLPFVIFAAPAGWLADRFPKRRVVIAAKAMELAAMALGAVGICLVNWPLVLTMVFMMGLQAAVFSPALNGSIPELYPAHHVLKANSVLKMATTVAILLGIIAAGLALDAGGGLWHGIDPGRALVAAVALVAAAAGLVSSFFVPSRPAARPDARFPWSGPVDTARELWAVRKDRLLTIVILADAFVWFVAVLQILIINKMGLTQLGLTMRDTSYLDVAELAGVAVGGLACGRLASGGRWFRVLPPAALALAGAMAMMGLVPAIGAAAGGASAGGTLRVACVAAILVLAGLAGGILLVPLEAFIQARPAADRKGRIIAAANCAAFSGMMLAGGAFVVLDKLLSPTTAFATMAVPTLAVAAWLFKALPRREEAI
jgi:acyl-[acyl-carrier-protein]-phospholipid O-acyltransferase/long-chain-fatty-acid--[acyl-carrier-protein] ligase